MLVKTLKFNPEYSNATQDFEALFVDLDHLCVCGQKQYVLYTNKLYGHVGMAVYGKPEIEAKQVSKKVRTNETKTHNPK